jgi:hypothetical protein
MGISETDPRLDRRLVEGDGATVHHGVSALGAIGDDGDNLTFQVVEAVPYGLRRLIVAD